MSIGKLILNRYIDYVYKYSFQLVFDIVQRIEFKERFGFNIDIE